MNNKKVWMGLAVMGMVLALGFIGRRAESDLPRKFLIILHASTETHEGKARALHALLYARELMDKGYDVALLFDGAGTEWAARFSRAQDDDSLAQMYHKIKSEDTAIVICDYCATAFAVKDVLQHNKETLTAEYSGHPSLVRWIEQGYEVLVL